jgi:chromosome segregation ATPase
MFKQERETVQREIKKFQKDHSEARQRRDTATAKQGEAETQSKTTQALYEACLAETGEARPELLQEVERLDREAKTQEATIRGLKKYIDETLPGKIAVKQTELKALDRQEGQRRLLAMVPDLNSAARKFGNLLREADEIMFTFAYRDFNYDSALNPIVGDFGALRIPRFFVKAEIPGGVLPDGQERYFWEPEMQLSRQVIAGTIQPPNAESETNIPARDKTAQEKIFELESRLTNLKNNFAGTVEYRDHLRAEFENLREKPAQVAEAEADVNERRAEIAALEIELEALRGKR